MEPKYTYLLNLNEQDYNRLSAKALEESLSIADALRLAIQTWAKNEGD